MKRFLSIIVFVLIAVLALCPVADAKKVAIQRLMNDSAGTPIDTFVVALGSTMYSESILIKDNSESTAVLFITEDKSGGSGDIDVNAQYSIDQVNWYSAYTTAMAGTTTIEGNIVTALSDTVEYIVHTIRVGMYMRYKFDPDAESQITAYLLYVTDN